MEVDDKYIHANEVLQQPEGTVSLITGFNKVIDIYTTMDPIVTVEMTGGMQQYEEKVQRQILIDCVRTVKERMENLPVALSLDLTPVIAAGDGSERVGDVQLPSNEYFDDLPGYRYYPATYGAIADNDLRHVIATHPDRRKQIQFDIQKANIYASQLATRSFYVEMFFNLYEGHHPLMKGDVLDSGLPANGDDAGAGTNGELNGEDLQDPGKVERIMWSERELIVQNLLTVLVTIPQRNMEPNGSSLITKIRQVASTLIGDKDDRKGPVARKVEYSLHRFVDILMRLEKTSGASSDGSPGAMTPQDEEQELRSWADLREYQMRFAHNGGFLGAGVA